METLEVVGVAKNDVKILPATTPMVMQGISIYKVPT